MHTVHTQSVSPLKNKQLEQKIGRLRIRFLGLLGQTATNVAA